MDAPKGKPLKAFPAGPRARKLQGFGIGAGREGKEAGQSPTVLPFGFHPIPYVPSRGLRLAEAGELRSLLTLKVQSHWPRRRICAKGAKRSGRRCDSTTRARPMLIGNLQAYAEPGWDRSLSPREELGVEGGGPCRDVAVEVLEERRQRRFRG